MSSSKPEQKDRATSPGTTFPTLCERCAGSLASPANHVTPFVDVITKGAHSPQLF